MQVTEAVVREEYFDNAPTGVELEQEDDPGDRAGADVVRPWNPAQIRVGTKQFSLRNILDLIADGDLELAPDFQRNQVWKSWQKSRLIESVLLQIPLPAFYFAEDSDGMMRVVDGLQRLSTIYEYVREQAFGLTDLEYLAEQVSSARFADLPPALQRRIHNAQIVAHVIDPSTPAGVKYDIFKRINTGGTPLNAQEIRHCMSRSRSRDLLKRLTSMEEFDRATSGRLRSHIRMDDREVALRFCAFSLMGVEGYRKHASTDAFLEAATAMLDDESQVADERIAELEANFRLAMSRAHQLFGDHAFRKWTLTSDHRNPINKSLFESWSWVLAAYPELDVERHADEIVHQARTLMTQDQLYIYAITASTGDPVRVQRRFAAVERLVQAVQ
jgi:hypothetical protein